MNRKYQAFAVAVFLAAPGLAENPSWKPGPGTMHLGDKAVLQVPQGYLYHEAPPVGINRNVPAASAVKVTALGAVQRGPLIVSFSYTQNPGALVNHLLLRSEAYLSLGSVASRTAQALSAHGRLATKVVRNDRFDPRMASLSFVIDVLPPATSGSKLMALFRLLSSRQRVTLLFARHGELLSEFGAPPSAFASRERDYEALLPHISFLPGEGPLLVDQIPLMSSNDVRPLPRYVLGGFLVGLAFALLRSWWRLRLSRTLRPATGTNL